MSARSIYSIIPLFAMLGSTQLCAEETIVVSATKRPIALEKIGSSVSIITREDLQSRSITYLDEALRALPGVSVTQSGGPGGISSVRIRGEEAYRTMVLIDGIRVDDTAGPQVATNFANITTSDVSQIEIVRGPQSLVYGADAIGGVVQVLTQTPKDGFYVGGDISIGSYETYQLNSQLAYGAERFSVYLGSSYLDSEGFSAKVGDPDLADDDGLTVGTFHGKASLDLAENLELEGVARWTDSEAQFDGASAFPGFSSADPNRVLETQSLATRGALVHTGWNGRTETELSVAYLTSERTDLSEGLPFVFGSKFDGDRITYSAISAINVAPDHTLVVGINHETSNAQTETIDEETSNTAVHAEWHGGFADAFFFTAGIRVDDHEDFGTHTSGRITAAWLTQLIADETTRLHASFGTGFRAPSLYERATNTAALLPALKEEESQGFDFGISQSFVNEQFLFDVTYFEQSIDNEIRFDNVGFTGYFQAAGTSDSRGLETTGNVTIPVSLGALHAINLSTAYTYTDSTVNSPDAENGLPRVRRPKHISATTLGFQFAEERAGLAFTLRTASDSEDGFLNFRTPLDAYAVFDVAARLQLSQNAEVFVRGVNVLDEQYQEVSGFATSGAALYLGLRAHN